MKLIGFFHRIKSISFLPEAFQCENIIEPLTSPFFRQVILPNSILNRYRFNFMNAPCFIWAKFLFWNEHVNLVSFHRFIIIFKLQLVSQKAWITNHPFLPNSSSYNTVCKIEQRQVCVRIYKEWKYVRRFFTKFPVC